MTPSPEFVIILLCFVFALLAALPIPRAPVHWGWLAIALWFLSMLVAASPGLHAGVR